MTSNPHTLIIWGAGATATIGMRTTAQQASYLANLACNSNTLDQRVSKALDNPNSSYIDPFIDLLKILGDGNQEGENFHITQDQMEAMRHNWTEDSEKDLKNRIFHLRQLYDWPTLKSVIRICPKRKTETKRMSFNLSDLFNILDMHEQSGHGFSHGNNFLSPLNLRGARNALKLLLLTMFYIDWQDSLKDPVKKHELKHHYDFARMLGIRMQCQCMNEVAMNPESPDFYLGDIAFASMNYDPIALWLQYVAFRDLNNSPDVPYVGNPIRRLQIYHDLGHVVPSRRISGKNPDFARFSMNESVAQRLNDPDHGASDIIRISKYLFPHGCLVWRECPSCGKLSSYLGDRWEADSPTLFIPPPLRMFVPKMPLTIHSEKNDYQKGEVDVRSCVHCKTKTYTHHTQVIMQSNFKTPPPPFIEEIQRELRILVNKADHIVFMGYSLPQDDVDYRAFLAARRQRDDPPVKCSVVVGSKPHHQFWTRNIPDSLDESSRKTLEDVRSLFGEDNVRFYGGGIPQVFMDGDQVTELAFDRLVQWDLSQ